MINRTDKPMLSVEEQIRHLQSKGVKFERISIEDATDYLRRNNNYFKLRAYRKNFPKHPGGKDKGKYINLDFEQLRDLSIIDMRMRYVFIHMALDIEHFAKVRLLHAIEESNDDGYEIVQQYLRSLQKMDNDNGTHRYDSLIQELDRNRGNPYCGNIIEKYDGCFPVWAFTEIVSLGTLIYFYGFSADYLGDKSLKDEFYLLQTIRSLRNAAAHSNCIIHDMGAKDAKHDLNYSISRALSKISKTSRSSQAKNERMRQIITLLYTHSLLVTSDGVKDRAREDLDTLINRMYHHIEYYSGNDNILRGFDFFKNAVDILFPADVE